MARRVMGVRPTSIPRLDTQLVYLPVVVRDKEGALVQNLVRSEFALERGRLSANYPVFRQGQRSAADAKASRHEDAR